MYEFNQKCTQGNTNAIRDTCNLPVRVHFKLNENNADVSSEPCNKWVAGGLLSQLALISSIQFYIFWNDTLKSQLVKKNATQAKGFFFS